MDITITINTDNAAFEGNTTAEIRRIINTFFIHVSADELIPNDIHPLIDMNGNKVGEVVALWPTRAYYLGDYDYDYE